MRRLIGRIVCAWTGKHKRGRLVGSYSTEQANHNEYKCPRCGERWTRKARNAGK